MKEQFKNLQIIFLALLLGQLAFAVAANFVIVSGTVTDTGVLIYLVPTVMIGGSALGFYLFDRNLKKVMKMENTRGQQFDEYRKNSLIRWALMEMGNLLAIVAAVIESKSVYFGLFGFGLLFFSTTRPNVLDFSKRFNLSLDEERKL
jgi:hypothetical protein